ncbi:MAG TPA: secondary thiamine-phosphate synthase enzyme YjbQ [Candidatus Binataceae bacterium]|nr:secondary thiamine-phosphate synthase enzyme YjbQ [Candidatus Binataceae bacterium]
MEQFRVRSTQRVQMLDITGEVNQSIARAAASAGLCNIFLPHTTAALIVCENWDPDVIDDLLQRLQHLVPQQGGYRHGEGNSQAHILSVMLGCSLTVPVAAGKLALGRWQGLLLAEFDGPRERQVNVSLIPAGARPT